MKKILLMLFLALNLSAVCAQQTVKFDVMGGVQFMTNLGGRAGVDVHIPFTSHSKWGFSPGLHWSMVCTSFKRGFRWTDTTSGDEYELTFSKKSAAHFLNVPLRVGVTLGKPEKNFQTRILFGPYLGIGLGGTAKYLVNDAVVAGQDNVPTFSDEGYYERRFDVGLNIGAHFVFWKHFMVGVHCDIGFLNIEHEYKNQLKGKIFEGAYGSILAEALGEAMYDALGRRNFGIGFTLGYQF